MGNLAINFAGLLTLCIVLPLCVCDDGAYCKLRPLGTKTEPLPPDNRFELEIVDVGDTYIPSNEYTVRLFSNDNQSTFIAFTLFLTAEKRENEKNKYRPTDLDPGRLTSSRDVTITDTVTLDKCKNTLFQADIKPKKSIQATWKAPPKGNKCVTIRAFLAIKPDVWYDAETPLAKMVCEDTRKADDMQPRINHNCSVCEEARYELIFEGTWSYNTHPNMFPKDHDLAKFSDIVGASHGNDFVLFKDNSEAGPGLQMMAEQGNTTELEMEILSQLGSNVRTLIKATAPLKPDMTTVTSFRVNRDKHFVSLVTSIIPSPDWFLGVANLEVCDVATGTWAKNVKLNLYPYDAGTDSGKEFESSNEATMPHQPITSSAPAVDIYGKTVKKEKPFAVLKVKLVRTYATSICLAAARNVTEEPSSGPEDNTEEPESIPETPPPSIERNTPDQNPTEGPPPSLCEAIMGPWSEWSSCEGDCEGGQINGYRQRLRDFKDSFRGKNIPENCLEESRTIEFEDCNEPCEEPTTTTEVPMEDDEAEQRRRWRQSLLSTLRN